MSIETVPPHLSRKLRRSGMVRNLARRRTGAGRAFHSRTCRSYGTCLRFRLQRTI